MQKCPQCGFRKVKERRVRDENGLDRGSQTVCTNCDAVIRDDTVIRDAVVEDSVVQDEVR